jgi:hypothetical protein
MFFHPQITSFRLFNTNVPLHLHIVYIRIPLIRTCFFISYYHSNYALFNSNVLNTLKCAQLHSTTLNCVLLNSYDLNILKCAQLHLTTSNCVFSNSNDHQHTQIYTNTHNQLKSPYICTNIFSSITSTQINIYNLQICTCTPTMFQSPNL